MNKKDKQKIKDKLKDVLTVQGLIDLLLEFGDKNAPIGISGHYGEFYGLHRYNFHENQKSRIDVAGIDGPGVEIDIVEISFPDIGPEPD